MRVLLDTHILYWWFYETGRLSSNAVKLVREAEEVFVSSTSLWEIAIKARIGKIKADPKAIIELIDANGFLELPVLFRHTALVADLPLLHSDPFDRLLIAQAMSEPLHLLTADAQLQQYSELVIKV